MTNVREFELVDSRTRKKITMKTIAEPNRTILAQD